MILNKHGIDKLLIIMRKLKGKRKKKEPVSRRRFEEGLRRHLI